MLNTKLYNLLLLLLLLVISCSPSNPTNEKEDDDPIDELPKLNPKKGFGITVKTDNKWATKLVELEASWHYSWGLELPNPHPEEAEFVPMIWGGGGATDANIDKVNSWAERKNVKFLLGFNEPDGVDQANMTVDKAIELWPKLMKARVPLVSPAPVHGDGQWLKDFMAKAKELGYRVEYIGIHWYKAPNSTQFLQHLETIHNLYNLPIWITEFGVADWNAKTPAENRYSPDQVLAFLREVLPKLDELDYIYRYAWFNSSISYGPLTSSALHNEAGELTTLGKYYKSFK